MKNRILLLALFLNVACSVGSYAQSCPRMIEDYTPKKFLYSFPGHPSTQVFVDLYYANCFIVYNYDTNQFENYATIGGGVDPLDVAHWVHVCTCLPPNKLLFRRYIELCPNPIDNGCDFSTFTLPSTNANNAAATWSQSATWSNNQVPNVTNSTVLVQKSIEIDVADLCLCGAQWLVITATGSVDIVASAGVTCNSVIKVNTGGQLLNHGLLKGIGEILGNFNNHGVFSPGNSPGTFTITGDYTAQSTATHNIELASTSSYDIINISGATALDGTLNVSLLNGFTPSVNDQFTFMTYGSETGAFSTVNLPTLPIGLYWNMVYNATNIVLSVTSILPVELTKFIATNTEGGNQLTWQTATERNTRDFDIERSSDSKTFDRIGSVKAKGTTQTPQYYRFVDDKPFDVTYYRLKINDLDNKSSCTKVESVTRPHKGFSVKAFPNPFDNNLTVDIKTDRKIDVTLTLTDILGRQVFSSHVQNTEGGVLPLAIGDLPNGSYLLKVSGNQQTVVQRVDKQ